MARNGGDKAIGITDPLSQLIAQVVVRSDGKYALVVDTIGGGTGGGDASSANQVIEIDRLTSIRDYLDTVETSLNTLVLQTDGIESSLTSIDTKLNQVPIRGLTLDLTGSASALNADLIASTDVSIYQYIAIQITGTFVGTITFQGSNDNTNFVSIGLLNVTSTGATNGVNTATTAGVFAGALKTKYLRVRMTAYTSGTANSTAMLSSLSPDDPINVVGANQLGTWSVRVQDNAGNGIQSAVASPASTDRGLIVRNIPQSNVVSTANTTSTPLGIGATYTGTFEDCLNAGIIYISVRADVASATNGFVVEFSADGVTSIGSTDSYTISANTLKAFAINPAVRFFRVVYTNGGTAQTSFTIQTVMKPIGLPSSAPLNSSMNDQNDGQVVIASMRMRDSSGNHIPVVGDATGLKIRDDFQAGEILADQAGAGAILTFTFTQAVNLIWVTDTGANPTNVLRVNPFGGTPTAISGIPVFNQSPTPITVNTTVVRVFAPVGSNVNVYGYYRT